MRNYLIKRIVQNVFTFIVFLTLVYFLMDLQPGSFADLYINDPSLTLSERQALEQQLGLDEPVHIRYLSWMQSLLLEGDLGISFSNYPRGVIDVIAERAPRTLSLFVTASVIAWYVGFTIGKIIAWRRGTLVEYAATLGGVSLFTVFTPWFGLMMIWLFAHKMGLFPIGKFLDPVVWRGAEVSANEVFIQMLANGLIIGVGLAAWSLFTHRLPPATRQRFWWLGPIMLLAGTVGYWSLGTQGGGVYALDILHHLILPIITLTLISFAGTMLLTRNSMLETMSEDYIETARAKGLPEKTIRDKHAARSALLPVVTSLVFALAFALDGGVITETVFSWPGMGQILVSAAQVEDTPMVVGALIFTGGLALTAHLVVDVLYAFLDPRIRYS